MSSRAAEPMGAGLSTPTPSKRLTGYAWLSIAAALSTMALKGIAYLVTGSVGLLSDALESCVNLVGAVVALFALRFAAQPADEGHPHGHEKAEYFSSAIEGALIVLAAVAIVVSAAPRLIDPLPLEAVGVGLGISVAASLINFGTAVVLLRAAKRHRSPALEGDGEHLMSDVWTSAGVIAGVLLVHVTGQPLLDPFVAILVAIHICWTGSGIVRRAATGLLDGALPRDELSDIEAVLDRFRREHGVDFHALRTRQAGARRFVSVHVLVPGAWTVQRGHDLSEDLERELRATGERTTVFTHLEPLEDEASFADQGLDR